MIVFSGVDFSLMDTEDRVVAAAPGRRGVTSLKKEREPATPVKRVAQPQVVLLAPPGLSEAIGQAIASPDGHGGQRTVALPIVDSSRQVIKENEP